MKKVGIIGGIGPASTLDYYNGIIQGYRAKAGENNYPELIVYSINMTEMLSYVECGEWSNLVRQLSSAVNALAKAGADFAVVASNTPHIVFGELSKKVTIPLISIVEETCKTAAVRGCQNPLVIGTLFTMKSGLYTSALAEQGIASTLPTEKEQEKIYSLFFPKLENGIVDLHDKAQMIELLNAIIKRTGADSLVLGCTELPLMIQKDDLSIPLLDTTQIHIEAVLRQLVSSDVF